MKRLIVGLMLLGAIVSMPVTHAQEGAASLGGCMVDALDGKERKQLAQWIFFAMSAHPEIASYANVSAPVRQDMDRTIGTLITRLLTEDCPEQTRSAVQTEGTMALRTAFEVVGRVAMQELMTDPGVKQGISGFEPYLDKEKFNTLMSAR